MEEHHRSIAQLQLQRWKKLVRRDLVGDYESPIGIYNRFLELIFDSQHIDFDTELSAQLEAGIDQFINDLPVLSFTEVRLVIQVFMQGT